MISLNNIGCIQVIYISPMKQTIEGNKVGSLVSRNIACDSFIAVPQVCDGTISLGGTGSIQMVPDLEVIQAVQGDKFGISGGPDASCNLLIAVAQIRISMISFSNIGDIQMVPGFRAMHAVQGNGERNIGSRAYSTKSVFPGTACREQCGTHEDPGKLEGSLVVSQHHHSLFFQQALFGLLFLA
jgi:hypothetical protein